MLCLPVYRGRFRIQDLKKNVRNRDDNEITFNVGPCYLSQSHNYYFDTEFIYLMLNDGIILTFIFAGLQNTRDLRSVICMKQYIFAKTTTEELGSLTRF